MRALLGRIYKGMQAAAALYVLAALALPTTAEPTAPVAPETPAAPVAQAPGHDALPAPAANAEPPAPAAPVAANTVPAAPAAREPAAESPPEKPSERPKPAIGFNIPEGQFNFEPAPGTAKLADAPPAFPFAPPPDPTPAELPSAPPIIHRRGFFRGPMRVARNPWSDPANLGFNQRGDAGRARAFAFDDRPEPPPGAVGSVAPTTVLKSWRRDVEQYRVLANQGHSEEELAHRLGDRFSSVRWAARLEVPLDELPPPTDSYAAALARERKPIR